MADTPLSLVNYIRAIAGAWRDDPRDDAQLLSLFVEARDEQAFKALLCRHGPLVWRTCKRVLGDGPDAEDACQAVFLTLARKASRLRANTLAGWLHRVARQAALNVNAGTKRHRDIERQLQTVTQPEELKTDHSELAAAVDEELANLPERLRVPLLLHYLEGKSQVEVARILGCARSVLQKRLTRAEDSLRKQLERRGLTLGVGLSVAALLGETNGISAMPADLIGSTTRAAMAFRAGTLTGGAADVAEKLMQSLTVRGGMWKGWWLVLAGIGSLGIGGAVLELAWKMCESGSKTTVDATAVPAVMSSQPVTAYRPRPQVDFYGDPLPPGAIARIGTIRFRGQGGKQNVMSRTGVALSPDGKTLAFASQEGIYFWDTATGRELGEVPVLRTKSNRGALPYEGIAFSPDLKLLAAKAPGGAEIVLQDTSTAQPAGRPLRGYSAVFTPDGKTLVCRTNRTSLTLYDVGTRKQLYTTGIGELDDNPYIAFSQDGQSLACAVAKEQVIAKEQVVHLLDIKTGTEQIALSGRQKVTALAFTFDGNIVTAGEDKNVRILSAKTGKELHLLGAMTEIPSLVSHLADGKSVLTACVGQICIWDASTGKETSPVRACKDLFCPIVVSSDGTKLIERVGNALSIRDVMTGNEIGPTAGVPRSLMSQMAFSPDGTMLATAADPTRIICNPDMDVRLLSQTTDKAAFYLWETATGKLLGSLPTPNDALIRGYSQVCWPSRDTFLAQGFYGADLMAKPGMFRWTNAGVGGNAVKTEVYDGSLKLSPDVHVLARRQGENFELLEVATRKKLATIACRCKTDEDNVVFSEDHKLLATQVAHDPTIALWEVSTGRFLYSFDTPIILPARSNMQPAWEHMIGFSPDGRLIATRNSVTHAVSLWEHVSGQLRLRLDMPPGCRISDLFGSNPAFSPDGCLLAIGCIDGPNAEKSIYIWDLATGQECQRFQGHRAGGKNALRITFSPDGRYLASSGKDYTVLIWDVKRSTALQEVNKPLNQEELQALKNTLANGDAAAAYRAILKLQQAPEQDVLPLMADCLRPQPITPDSMKTSRELTRLINDLDSDEFQIRMNAAKELARRLNEESGEPIVETALRQAVAGKLSIEVKVVATQLLNKMKEKRLSSGGGGAGSPELTRMVRAIEVLERINSASSRDYLQKLVAAPPRPEIQREAEAALKRLTAYSLAPAKQ